MEDETKAESGPTKTPWPDLVHGGTPADRDTSGRWTQGNKAWTGRRRAESLVAFLRRETLNGVEAAEYVLSVLRDERQSTATRLEAATWIAAYACGRPVATQVSVEVPALGAGQELETWLKSLTTSELRALVDAEGALSESVAAKDPGPRPSLPGASGGP